MSEDLIAQACAKIERLQASNDEYRKQADRLTKQADELTAQATATLAEVERLKINLDIAAKIHNGVKGELAAREAALAEARKHVSELREGFCVFACPDEGHLATCLEANKWLAAAQR
jgi:chromosome segregation ATPase